MFGACMHFCECGTIWQHYVATDDSRCADTDTPRPCRHCERLRAPEPSERSER